MTDLSKLPKCANGHGRFTGRACPLCDWNPSVPPPAVAASVEYDRATWHRGPEKELHDWFEAEMVRLGVTYIHGRMDKESTIRKGWPDFSMLYTAPDGITRGCCVELKSKTTPILKDQVKVIAELRALNIPVLVTGDFREACEFVRCHLAITQPALSCASACVPASPCWAWTTPDVDLPETYEPVIVAGSLEDEDGYMATHEAFWCGRNWWSVRQRETDMNAKKRIHNVTHWTRMPSLPNVPSDSTAEAP